MERYLDEPDPVKLVDGCSCCVVVVSHIIDALWHEHFHERQNADLIEAVAGALVRARSVIGDTGDLLAFVNTFISTIAVDRGRLALQSSLTAHAEHNPHLADQLTLERDRLRQTLEPYLLDVVDRAGRELTTDATTFTRAVMAAQSGAAAQLIAPDDPDDIRPLLVATTMFGLSQPRAPAPTGESRG